MSKITTYRMPRNKYNRSKYGNRKCTLDGISFDSVKEMNHYCDLKYLLMAGEISDLEVHKPFELQEAFRAVDGSWVRAITYEADFVYKDKDGNTVIEDVKSKATKTAVYNIKKKMMAYRGMIIKEVE
jgi:hypothetical protein